MKLIILFALKVLLTLLKLPFVPILLRPKQEWIIQSDELIAALKASNTETALEIASSMDFAYGDRIARESRLLFLNIWRKASSPLTHPVLSSLFFAMVSWLTWITIKWTWDHIEVVFWSTVVSCGLWWVYKKFKDHLLIKPWLDILGEYSDEFHKKFNAWILQCVDEEARLQESESAQRNKSLFRRLFG